MGEFAGIVRRDGNGIEPALAARLERALSGVGRVRRWRDHDALLLFRAHRPAEAAVAARQPVPSGQSAMLVADIALDDSVDMASQLGESALHRCDAELAALACARWGDDAAARLRGGFSFAHWDAATRRLVLARDPIGSRSVYYVEHSDYIFFGSLLQILLTIPEVPRDIDELVLARMMTLDQRDEQTTLYRAIRVVPPGAIKIFTPDRSDRRFYWSLADIPQVRFRRDDDYVEAAREIFDRSVATRVKGHDRIATTVSGGLDSAGMAATLARQSEGGTIHAFHRAPAVVHPYTIMDERALVLELTARYPQIALHIVDRPSASDGSSEPEREAGLTAMPRFGGVDGRWFDTMIEDVVAYGPDVLLLGDAGNATLSWSGRPQTVSDVLRGRWGRAARGIARIAAKRQQSFGGTALRQIIGPLLPLPLRRWRQQRALGTSIPWASYAMVSADFLSGIRYLNHARETGHDIPFVPRQGDAAAARLANLRGRAHRDGGGISRRHWPFEVRDPYADRRLAEFTLGIPEEQYWRAGTDRWLARRVLADRLPPSIVDEWRRGMQCPEWYHDVTARRDGLAAAIERIERSPLASRVVDVPRMKRLLDEWPKDAEAARDQKQLLGHALQRGVALGGFLRWHEGGNG